MKKLIIIIALIICAYGFIHNEQPNQQDGQFILSQIDESNDSNGVQPFDIVLGKTLAALSLASYCTKSKITKWKCGTPCKDYPGMTDITVFKGSFSNDNHAYVGYLSSINAIVTAFKGSESIRNWLEDFDIIKIKYPYCDGCYVHQGFFDGYNSMQDDFWNAFNPLREKYPTAQIITTGHSLGAALSQMHAADLINHGVTDFLFYNYGCPRVGNAEFASWFTSQHQQRLYRVTHHQDPVPHAIAEDFGYRHLAQEVFYVNSSKPTKEHILCNMSGEDPKCSDKYLADLNVLDHNYYMGYNFILHMGLCKI